MNEQIKKLWEQCKTPDWSYDNQTYDHEKFAELLVKNCTKQCEEISRLRAKLEALRVAPINSQPLTLDQIHEALLSVCGDGSAPTSTDDPEFIELIVPLARAIEAKIKGGA